MLGESVVAAVVCRHGHDGPSAVAGEHIVAHVNGYLFACYGVGGVRAGEHACYFSVRYTLQFGAPLNLLKVFFHLGMLFAGCQQAHIFALWRQHHKCHAEYRVGAGRENGDVYLSARTDAAVKPPSLEWRLKRLEMHLRAFAASYPVALRVLDGLRPVDALQAVEQPLRVCAHAQAPLPHHALLHRVAAALRQSVDNLIVGQHRTQCRTPVDFGVGKVSQAVVHQRVLPLFFVHGVPPGGAYMQFFSAGGVQPIRAVIFKMFLQTRNRHGLAQFGVVVVVEHLDERPLRPVVIFGVAGAYRARPVVAQPYFVQLLAVARDVHRGGLFGMLPGLYGVLLGRQSVCVKAHRVQHVKAAQTFVAAEYVAGDVAQRMPHVQPCARGVGEHVQNVILWLITAVYGLVSLAAPPLLLPALLYFLKFVFRHISFIFCLLSFIFCLSVSAGGSPVFCPVLSCKVTQTFAVMQTACFS